jgi:hypothetical protein
VRKDVAAPGAIHSRPKPAKKSRRRFAGSGPYREGAGCNDIFPHFPLLLAAQRPPTVKVTQYRGNLWNHPPFRARPISARPSLQRTTPAKNAGIGAASLCAEGAPHIKIASRLPTVEAGKVFQNKK